VTVRPEICVKMLIFKVDVQSDHLETKCSWVKVSQGKSVTVDVSSGSKCHSGRNVGGRNVKASTIFSRLYKFSTRYYFNEKKIAIIRHPNSYFFLEFITIQIVYFEAYQIL
jgi:hypothetical protein